MGVIFNKVLLTGYNMTKRCFCSQTINPSLEGSAIYEEDYCSTYCRIYDEKGLEPINGQEKTGLKQLSGLMYSPVVKMPCDYCGVEFRLKGSEKRKMNANFCSKECHKKITKLKIKKSLLNYTIIKSLHHHKKHGEGWITLDRLNEIMSRSRNFKSTSRRLSMFLKTWIGRGLVEKKMVGSKSHYRLSDMGLNYPIAKVFVDCIPKKVVN